MYSRGVLYLVLVLASTVTIGEHLFLRGMRQQGIWRTRGAGGVPHLNSKIGSCMGPRRWIAVGGLL